MRGPSAFAKTTIRAIRGTLGRFLAIMGIVALGCGFYAGLQMCGPDMRSAADTMYDEANLYDVRLASTMGFEDEDAKRVSSVEGVESVMPAISCDAIARLGQEQLVVRIGTVDMANATDALAPGGFARDGHASLNHVELRDGRWPNAPNECVISADTKLSDAGVGSTVELMHGTSDLDDVFRERSLKVVGTVSSSYFPYTGTFGSTALGSGTVGLYAYVAPSAFVEDMPYTELYLRVSGADAYESGSSAYEGSVGTVTSALDMIRTRLAEQRLAAVRADAIKEWNEGRREFETERDKARAELDGARDQLEDAAAELASGERELEEGRSEYESGVATFQSKSADANRQLAEGQSKIDDARKQVEQGTRELDEARKQVEQGRSEYESGLAALCQQTGAQDLEGAKASLELKREQATAAVSQLQEALNGAQQIADGKTELEGRRAQLADGRAELTAGTNALLSGLASQGIVASTPSEAVGVLSATIAQLEASKAPEANIAPLRTALGQAQQLVSSEAELAQGEQALTAAQAELDASEQQLLSGLAAQGISVSSASEATGAIGGKLEEVQAGIQQVDEGLAGVSKLEEAKAQLDEGTQKLESGQRELDAAKQQVASGQSTLDSQRAEAQRQLAQGQQELDDAKEKLDQGERELSDGWAEYEEGLDTYLSSEAEANERLSDAERELDDAKKKIDDLEAPDIYALGRDKNEGIVTYDGDTHRMDSIADVFPLIFFLVAALVALTTMTRTVEDERVLIGTYKALGYSTGRIASKYLAYAGAASLTGAIVGITLLSQVLPFIVTMCYGIIYTVPKQPFPLPIDPVTALISGGLGVGVTLLATWLAVVNSLREVPASLMLPRAPVAGKRILLERITPVWRSLSFSWKVTCRNLFRYKRRMFMTVIGISGCTALLLVGFGLHDAIWDIIDCQYGPIVHYDTTVVFDDDLTGAQVTKAVESVQKTNRMSDVVRVQQHNMRAGGADAETTTRIVAITPRDADELSGAVTLRARKDKAPLTLDDDAVIVTEKTATLCGVGVGDQILLYEQDDIGNAKGVGRAVQVTGIAENYVGHYAFLGSNAWREAVGTTPAFSTIYANSDADKEAQEELSAALHDRDDVTTVTFSAETIDTYRNMISVVNLIVVVLIVSAGLLAFIVLYNLTNINVEERVREIASLKVLGFTKGEVYAYIFREIILLSLMGDVLGMVLGTFLATFVITTAEVDYVMFGRSIHPPSYLYAFALTIVFTVLILFVMRKKLDRVNMVESLKSVE